ncbi:MAG: sugar ABC transporter permease, partial [Verrucomicrobia bacterium]|nr:sugar ABC transporter permease [Verrucomicrobiota bacterium]
MLFVAPWVVGFLFLNLYPFLASVWYSLCDYSALSVPVFLGFQNYADLFRDPVFWKALSNTV